MSAVLSNEAAPASVVFQNLATILKAGLFMGEMARAAAEAINFCEQVAAAEAEKEKIAKAAAKRARKGKNGSEKVEEEIAKETFVDDDGETDDDDAGNDSILTTEGVENERKETSAN